MSKKAEIPINSIPGGSSGQDLQNSTAHQQPEQPESEWESKMNAATGKEVVVNRNTGEAFIEIEAEDGSLLGGILSAAASSETNQVRICVEVCLRVYLFCSLPIFVQCPLTRVPARVARHPGCEPSKGGHDGSGSCWSCSLCCPFG